MDRSGSAKHFTQKYVVAPGYINDVALAKVRVLRGIAFWDLRYIVNVTDAVVDDDGMTDVAILNRSAGTVNCGDQGRSTGKNGRSWTADEPAD